MAGPRSVATDQPSTTGNRSAAFMEEGEADDYDDCEYDDIDNIKNDLTSWTSGAKADLNQHSGSVLG